MVRLKYSLMGLILAVFAILMLSIASGFVVDPSNMSVRNSVGKAKENQPKTAEEFKTKTDASQHGKDLECHIDVDILWRAELGTPIYNVPVITDLYGDGKKEIVFSTAMHYVEALNSKGQKAEGWPFAFADSAFVASPIVYDIDRDGSNEIVVTTENGEIAFLGVDGFPILNATLRVPPLRVRKDWYSGIDFPDVMASYNLAQDAQKGSPPKPKKPPQGEIQPKKRKPVEKSADTTPITPLKPAEDAEPQRGSQQDPTFSKSRRTRNLMQVDDVDDNDDHQKKEEMSQKIFSGFEGWLTEEGLRSLDLFLPSSTPESYVTHLIQDKDPLYSLQYEEYLQNFPIDDENGKYVYVDSHVLHTPVIADLDNDGGEDLIVPVSYYFDVNFYGDAANIKKIAIDVEISKYIGSGIVVFDLLTRKIKWTAHLDLTTARANFASYVYSSPTVVDLDADGTLEILISTGTGFIYALSSDGAQLEGYPIIGNPFFASVTVEDVNEDGLLEIIVTDTHSTVICYSNAGEEIWASPISGYSNQAPVIGDVNGDGELDVVLGTTEGHIFAFDGVDGQLLDHFPVRTRGRIQSQALLVPLNDNSKALHIVVAAYDGHVYMIDGSTGCFEKVDIGESSYSMVLADDVNQNGKLDLVVTTRNGDIFVLETTATFHPLKAWTSQNQGRNGFTSKYHQQGIYVMDSTRSHRDISGESFLTQFEIVDNREKVKNPFYDVKIYYGSEVLLSRRYTLPGVYTEVLRCPNKRTTALVHVEMQNEHKQAFFDEFSVSFNVHFHRLLKWILVGPFVVMSAVLYFARDIKSPLPTFG